MSRRKILRIFDHLLYELSWPIVPCCCHTPKWQWAFRHWLADKMVNNKGAVRRRMDTP